jgi:sigma54-dependent transcription regulator
MEKALFAWIGLADLAAAEDGIPSNLGPIGQAAKTIQCTEIVLLSDHPSSVTERYAEWLEGLSRAAVSIQEARLSSPTCFGEIYEHVVTTVSGFRGRHERVGELVFHLSPGTPAMAAVWIIAAKTRFPATLIESSVEKGVSTASVPFDISADYLPDLLRKPDDELVRLSQGLPPEAPEFDDIVHRSPTMKQLIAKARLVAPRSIPVLLLGESGTGKELLARAIHRASALR